MDLEHVNLVVTDPRRSADLFERLFGWETRWSGAGLYADSECIHVGTTDNYIALATSPKVVANKHIYPVDRPGLAHVGVVVDDIDDVLIRVREEGINTFNHNDIAPGSRFYFFDYDDICWEVASYEAASGRDSAQRAAITNSP